MNTKQNMHPNAIHSIPARVDDIVLKFVEPTVHNIQHEKEEYVTKKEQFKKYMQNG